MQENLFKPDTSTRILVIGDIILDQYLSGETSRISPEAPVPVVKVDDSEERPGGAANVALNIASLNLPITLLGLTGNDDEASRLESLLTEKQVECQFVKQTTIPTIKKVRVLSRHQQLIRLDYEQGIETDSADKMIKQYEMLLPNASLVLLSDYAKGSLKNIREMIVLANKKNIPVLVDPKSDDFSIYQNASIITPNLKEFEAIVGTVESTDDIVNKGTSLLNELKLDHLLVTRGDQGMTLIYKNGESFHLHAQTHEVFDVTGAGDTVIATLAAGIASGYSVDKAVNLANIAAGLVVEKLGAAAVEVDEINAQLNTKTHLQFESQERSEAIKHVEQYKRAGERIVMTNGCFDILHAGHVSYLEQAKALGDKLIVAVNSDDSVARLKGTERPYNDLNSRMKLLSALACVDLVIAFDEDTPEQLISTLLPDVLVKGGDYSEDQIAGAKAVKANGGDVKILSFETGYSTTATVEKIKNSG